VQSVGRNLGFWYVVYMPLTADIFNGWAAVWHARFLAIQLYNVLTDVASEWLHDHRHCGVQQEL